MIKTFLLSALGASLIIHGVFLGMFGAEAMKTDGIRLIGWLSLAFGFPICMALGITLIFRNTP